MSCHFIYIIIKTSSLSRDLVKPFLHPNPRVVFILDYIN